MIFLLWNTKHPTDAFSVAKMDDDFMIKNNNKYNKQ